MAMRGLWALLLLLAAVSAHGSRILLIPLDSRPATSQFAQMIARMADQEVDVPPTDILGRFTTPGRCQDVLAWLEDQDYSDVGGVIVSLDMALYGGLVASRTGAVALGLALDRLRDVARIRAAHPGVPFYAVSAVMRLTPTATRENAAYRLLIGRYAELKEKASRTKSPANAKSLQNLLAKIPPQEIALYEHVRRRNHAVQMQLIRMMGSQAFDYLVFGQDDARPYGPHVPETLEMKRLTGSLGLQRSIYFCEGIDQHANVLLSRALLTAAHWTPKVRVVYSDDLGKRMVANYESKPVAASVADELVASGAQPVDEFSNEPYDYSLFVNTPRRREPEFGQFLDELKSEAEQGFPVAVADIDLGNDGTGDPELFDGLWEQQRMVSLLSYAGWNTAGNTLGTAIPAANVYLLARRTRVAPAKREIAQREFLLHRYVNDFLYHKFVRPDAYRMIDANPNVSRDEVIGPFFNQVQDFVRTELGERLNQVFGEQFRGKRFFAGTTEYEMTGLREIQIELPWPRAYEVKLDFRIDFRPVEER